MTKKELMNQAQKYADDKVDSLDSEFVRPNIGDMVEEHFPGYEFPRDYIDEEEITQYMYERCIDIIKEKFKAEWLLNYILEKQDES